MQIKIQNVIQIFNKKSPWEFVALNDVSLKINDGEYVGIIGSTGSGKTTLIEHFNGLLKPTNGYVHWHINDNNNITDWFYGDKTSKFKFKDLRKKIGIVFQFAEYQLFKNTIKEDIAFAPIAFGMPKEKAYQVAAQCLEEVGLGEEYLERSPFELSGGQKRRVAIAGVLAMNPDFLVFDEPTAGLDPVGTIEILDILSKLHQKGKTIINVTHDLDRVLERTTRTVMLRQGKIVADGQTYDVLNDINLLKENYLEPPKLLAFIYELKAKGIDVPKVKNIKELADYLNQSIFDKEDI